MAYSISSLLEHPTKLEEAFASNNGGENANPNNMQQNKNAFHSNKYNQKNGPAEVSQVEEVHGCLFDNFYIAYDALDLKNSNKQNLEWIMRGIDLTKNMQHAIVRVGSSLITKK